MMLDQDELCVGCGTHLCDGFHIDHILAQSAGGSSHFLNLQLLCERCNRAKFNMAWYEFIDHALKIVEYQKGNKGFA